MKTKQEIEALTQVLATLKAQVSDDNFQKLLIKLS